MEKDHQKKGEKKKKEKEQEGRITVAFGRTQPKEKHFI